MCNISRSSQQKAGKGMDEAETELKQLHLTSDPVAKEPVSELESELLHLLAGQNIPAPSLDVTVKGESEYVPVTKQTVCYIVCGIVFNEHDEILMMQEAKSSCYGMWYLPAGRMESNENITEAVQREVKEETGIEFEPTSMLALEVATGFWYRFTLTGRVTGGTLKTYEQRDKESLQAKWCSIGLIKSGRKGFPLRASDILPLLDIAIHHRSVIQTSPSDIHSSLLPAINPHSKLLLRGLFLQSTGDGRCKVLCSIKDGPHVPVGMISADDISLQVPLYRLIQTVFGHVKLHPKVHGIVQVEHCGRPAKVHDGLCLTLLVTMASKDGAMLPPIANLEHYEWCAVSDALQSQLCDMMKSRKTIPLLLLR